MTREVSLAPEVRDTIERAYTDAARVLGPRAVIQIEIRRDPDGLSVHCQAGQQRDDWAWSVLGGGPTFEAAIKDATTSTRLIPRGQHAARK